MGSLPMALTGPLPSPRREAQEGPMPVIGNAGRMCAAEYRMFGVFRGSEKLSHLLKVAELLGGQAGGF